MTIAAYQTLYESSVAFGMRKALQAEQGKADMEKMVRTQSCLLWLILNINIQDTNKFLIVATIVKNHLVFFNQTSSREHHFTLRVSIKWAEHYTANSVPCSKLCYKSVSSYICRFLIWRVRNMTWRSNLMNRELNVMQLKREKMKSDRWKKRSTWRRFNSWKELISNSRWGFIIPYKKVL